jgi:putative tryptophan/tyrosine transport system substrate-binding protein
LTLLAAVGSTLATTGILLGSTALGAEPEPRARVGILNTLGTTKGTASIAGFVRGLERFGYVEGRNLTIDFRDAEDRPARLPGLAQELVRLKPDVILTLGTTESTLAAIKESSTIPIVFVHAVDPVGTGLVASLGRPGGNVTGVTSLNADLGAKRLDLITEMVHLLEAR